MAPPLQQKTHEQWSLMTIWETGGLRLELFCVVLVQP